MPSVKSNNPLENGFIFETTRLGNTVKVCAIDPITAQEAMALGPANVPIDDLRLLAAKKLLRVLKGG